MDRKVLSLSLVVSILILPASAAAFEFRRDYSEFWNLTNAERSVDLEERIEDLKNDLRLHQIKMAKHEKNYLKIVTGLRYEKSTLARERDEMDKTVNNNRLIERDILSRLSLVGPPKHLKRWRLQKSLRNAQHILSTDSAIPYEDLERRENLLANETSKFERSYLLERRKLQKEYSLLKGKMASLQNDSNYSSTDRRNVFLGSILKPEREDFLQPRKLQRSAIQARRAQRLKAAVMSAKTDNYLTRTQPEVQSSIEDEIAAKRDTKLKLIEKAIAESLGSNISPEELKRLALELFMQGE